MKDMFDFLLKIIELFLTHRKNKFKKIEAVLERRQNFIDEVKKIEKNEDLTDDEKRALKNSCAQLVCGSRFVSFELVDYYFRNKKFKNFENITPMVAFWEVAIEKEYDEKGSIKSIKINNKKHFWERLYMIITFLFIFFIDWIFIKNHDWVVNILVKYLPLNIAIADIIFVVLLAPLICLTWLAFFGMMTVIDLKSYTEDES
ncbi:hypothetical protein ACX1N5_01630 [Acinetobacter sp. ANC 4636]